MTDNLSKHDTADLLGEAERASADRREQESQLTDADVRDVAEQLGIEEQDLHEASVRLTVRERFQTAVREHRSMITTVVAGLVAAFFFIFTVGALTTNARLSSVAGDVEEHRSAMDRAYDSYEAVVSDYQLDSGGSLRTLPPADRAIVEGARNRFRVESRRYDEDVNAYNDIADGNFGKIARGLMGGESSYPSSDEIEEYDL